MEIYKIKITPQAQRQMSEVYSYIKDFLKEPIAAAHFLEDIEKAVLSLDIMPKRVALVEEEPWRSHGIIPVKSIRSSEIIS